MAIPSGGYDTATITNPSSALTDFTLIVDLSRMSTSWWAEVNTSDGTRGRASKDDGLTELATDWIDFNDTAETGLLRVKWTGTLASSGTQIIRIYPPNTANTAYGVSDTYGQHNAYDSVSKLASPDGGGDDRTSNGLTGTGQGGITIGGASGKLGDGTDYEHDSTQYVDFGDVLDLSFPLTFRSWVTRESLSTFMSIISKRSGGTFQYQFRLASFGALSLLTTGGAKSSTLQISDSNFHYIAVSVDSSGNATFYLDGSIDSPVGAMSIASKAVSMTVGQGDVTINQTWDGILNQLFADSTNRSVSFLDQEYAQTNDNATFWGTWTWTSAGTTYNVSISESAGLSETQSATIDYPVSITDGIGLNETQDATIAISVNLSDGLGLNDVIESLAEYNISLSDGIGLNEILSSGDLIDGRMCVTITGKRANITISAISGAIEISAVAPSIDFDAEGCQ